MGSTHLLRAAAFLAALLGASSASAVLPPASAWDLPGTARVRVSGGGRSSSQLVLDDIRLVFDGAGGWTIDYVTDPLAPDVAGTVLDARRNRFRLFPDPAAEAAYFEALRLAILDSNPLITDVLVLTRSWRAKGRVLDTDAGEEIRLRSRLRAKMEVIALGRSARLRVALKGRYLGSEAP